MVQNQNTISADNSLDPETLRTLGAIYDLAVAKFHAKGQQPDAVCETIAARIMDSAMRGERDLLKLCQEALRGITRPN
jgi:hypothetical protein